MKIQYQDKHLIILESALYRTTTTLIIGEEYLLLADPNWLPIEIDFIQQVAEKEGKDKEKYLLFTHSDYDHIIGYNAFPDFITIASKAFVENEGKDKVLAEIQKFDDEYYIERTYKIEYPKIDMVLDKPTTKLSLHRDQYIFYQAKGHNQDGLVTLNASKGIIVVGDYLSNIEFPFIYESLANYHSTLLTLQSILVKEQVKMLVPGHGDHTQEISEMQRRMIADLQYLTNLEQAIVTGTPFGLSALLSKYPYPKGIEKFHLNNVELVKKELLEG